MSQRTVSNPDLKKVIGELYRPGASVGDGGAADKLRAEVNDEKWSGRTQDLKHWRKVVERVRNLKQIERRLVGDDLETARTLRADLEAARDDAIKKGNEVYRARAAREAAQLDNAKTPTPSAPSATGPVAGAEDPEPRPGPGRPGGMMRGLGSGLLLFGMLSEYNDLWGAQENGYHYDPLTGQIWSDAA